MKISYNWLCQFLQCDKTPTELAEILTNIGLEVEAMETAHSVKGGLKDLLIGKVESCVKHPNADKLNVTQVNLGNGIVKQIVCGAPNVAQGQTVIVAPVGAFVHPTQGEAFEIKKAKIRGEVSEGMICADDEIGLGTSHEGIRVLPDDINLGTLASDYFKVTSDTVFEIGLTPNRSDAQCHEGVTNDVYAYLKTHGHNATKLSPHKPFDNNANEKCPIKINTIHSEKCARYAGVYIQQVEVKESPEWLKNCLQTIGVRSINNIVDITNYVLHSYGQPLHAFDADKIQGNEVRVHCLPEGTLFVGLDEKSYTLSNDDLIICDGNNNPICIAGVFGGNKSGVSISTKNIFLESACFMPITTRKSSNRHLLRTDSAQRFEKGVDRTRTLEILQIATQLILDICGGNVVGNYFDQTLHAFEPSKINVKTSKVNDLTGLELNDSEVEQLLHYLDFKIIDKNHNHIVVQQPSNKIDVTRPADVIEEILRIYGLNNVKIPTTMQSSIEPSDPLQKEEKTNKVAECLCSLGFNEIITNSMSQSSYADSFLSTENTSPIKPLNSINANIDTMRKSLLFGGLETIAYNNNRKNANLRLFEFGKIYFKSADNTMQEVEQVALFITGQAQADSWLNTQKRNNDFFELKNAIVHSLQCIGVNVQIKPKAGNELLDNACEILSDKSKIGVIGEIKMDVTKKMDVAQSVYYAEIDLQSILVASSKNKIIYKPISKYQDVERDLALVLDEHITFEQIQKVVNKTANQTLKQLNVFDVFSDKNKLGEGKKSYAIHLSFNKNETAFEEGEIENVMKNVQASLEKDLNAIIRS